MTRTTRCAGFAAALAALLAPSLAWSQDPERCYGAARAGENDGMAGSEAAGGASVDFQGDAWAWVPAGECLTMQLPAQADGTPRRGSYQPLARDRP